MRGDTKVIEYLNAVLKGELTAVNQYWLHYRTLDNLGIAKLAAHSRHESIDEMKHADQLIARIFFLDGLSGDAATRPAAHRRDGARNPAGRSRSRT